VAISIANSSGRLIRQTLPPGLVSSAGSPLIGLIEQLDMWYANLPHELQITELNMYIQKDTNILGAVFFVHLAYHAAVADLTRVSLPGFNFPLASSFAQVPGEFRRQCQERCRYHADEVSKLVKMGLKHGTRPFDDPFCFIAAYEATKIQIVYTNTVAAGLRAERSRAEANIRVNTKLMNLMGRDGSHVHVSYVYAVFVQ